VRKVSYEKLLEGFKQEDIISLARIITEVENNPEKSQYFLDELYKDTGNAHVIGITGPPGAGKSSLVGALTKEIRKQGKTVGILLNDPSSPITGGAILGDRIRMKEIYGDDKVFIRSLASRGNLGGLSKAAKDIVTLYDAFGWNYIIVETVGAGQSEVDIEKLAYTTLVVSVPGLGDKIQSIKAGILEIADIHVVNKSDLAGADKVVSELDAMLDDTIFHSGWRPPVIKTCSEPGLPQKQGIPELFEEIQNHYEHISHTNALEKKKKRIIKDRIEEMFREKMYENATKKLETSVDLDSVVEDFYKNKKNIHETVDSLMLLFKDEKEELYNILKNIKPRPKPRKRKWFSRK